MNYHVKKMNFILLVFNNDDGLFDKLHCIYTFSIFLIMSLW